MRSFAGVLIPIIFMMASRAEAKVKHLLGFPEKTWGLGVVVGEPVGARASYFVDWKRALSVTADYSLSNVYQLSGDYLFYFYRESDRLRNRDLLNSLFFYTGPGAIVGTSSSSDSGNSLQAGGRWIAGSEYVFDNSNLAIRFELAANVYLKGRTALGGQALIGLTYYMFPDHKKKSDEFDEFQESSRPSRPKPRPSKKKAAPVEEDDFGDGDEFE